jgi:hypothetical protein
MSSGGGYIIKANSVPKLMRDEFFLTYGRIPNKFLYEQKNGSLSARRLKPTR